MVQRKSNSLSKLKEASELIDVIAAIANNKQFNDALKKVVDLGGETIQKLVAASKTADPMDDLEAKIYAMRDLANKSESQKLSALDREAVLKNCVSYEESLTLIKLLNGKDRKRKVKAVSKQIDSELASLISALTSPKNDQIQ